MSKTNGTDGRKNNGGPRPKTRPTDRRGAQPGHEGQAPFIPTPEQRELVAKYAVVLPQDLLAAKMGISVSTLLRHFSEEIDVAMTDAVASAGARLFQMAMNSEKPNLGALIFFLRTRGRWAERHELSGPGGLPLGSGELADMLQTKKLDDDQLRIIESALEILASGSSG